MKSTIAFFLCLITAPSIARGDDAAGVFGNKRVLIVGIDGVRADGLQAANTPNMDALIATGAVSYDAFADGVLGTAKQQVTSSGPGWSSILTGVWTDKHNVTSNSFSPNDFANYPHLFKRIKEANSGACTASIVQWDIGEVIAAIQARPNFATDATGIKIERDGTEIATLPLAATGYIDQPPLAGGGGFTRFDYTVHSYGGTEGDRCPVQSCTAEFFDGDLDTGLVVHLALEGNTDDSSGSANSNNGTANGDVTYQGGGVGQYLRFDSGQNPREYMTLDSPTDLDFGTSTDFSVSLLVKSSGGFSTDHAIISNKNWSSGGKPGWIIAVNTNGSWQWNIGDGADRLDYDDPANQINDDLWQWNIGDGSERVGDAVLYFDGQQIARRSLAAIGNIDSGLSTAVGTDGTLGTIWPNWFDGAIDSVRVWRRRLSAAEVAFIYDYDSEWFDWRETVFSLAELADPSISGPLADPSGNGVVNLLSFAQSNSAPGQQPPVGLAIPVSAEGFLQITCRRRRGGIGRTGVDYTVGGIRYTVERSIELSPATWQSGDTVIETVGSPAPAGGGMEDVTVRSKLPLAAGLRQFLRLSVEMP